MIAQKNGNRPTAARRRASPPAVVTVLAAGLTACSGSSSALPPAGGGHGGGKPSAYTQAQVVAAAPVAPASAITPGSWMAKVKKQGYLRVGGTDSGALFSQRNPATGQLEGFDAGLSQMLAKYIIGKPTTKLSLTTVDTRETMLQNGTVDAVFATYTITPQRAQKVDFAGPYYESGDAILVKSTTPRSPRSPTSTARRWPPRATPPRRWT